MSHGGQARTMIRDDQREADTPVPAALPDASESLNPRVGHGRLCFDLVDRALPACAPCRTNDSAFLSLGKPKWPLVSSRGDCMVEAQRLERDNAERLKRQRDEEVATPPPSTVYC